MRIYKQARYFLIRWLIIDAKAHSATSMSHTAWYPPVASSSAPPRYALRKALSVDRRRVCQLGLQLVTDGSCRSLVRMLAKRWRRLSFPNLWRRWMLWQESSASERGMPTPIRHGIRSRNREGALCSYVCKGSPTAKHLISWQCRRRRMPMALV